MNAHHPPHCNTPSNRSLITCIARCTITCLLTVLFGREVYAGTPVVQPNPTPFFIPNHTGGDRDFHGNGPQIFVSVRLEIRNLNEIWARVFMSANEIGGDGTMASGVSSSRVYTHNTQIFKIHSTSSASLSYTDNDHATDTFTISAPQPVRTYTCVGDTRGSEAGLRTGVSVSFNPIIIEEEVDPIITYPVPVSKLANWVPGQNLVQTINFTWHTIPDANADHWWIYVGTQKGTNDIGNSSLIPSMSGLQGFNDPRRFASVTLNFPQQPGLVHLTLWRWSCSAYRWTPHHFIYRYGNIPL